MGIPITNEGILNFATTFHNVAAGAPADFGLTAERLAQYRVALNRYSEALTVATTPETRTRVAIERKNTAKQTLLRSTRLLVNVCDNWPEMTDEKRMLLGITVRKPRTPGEPPKSKPIITIESIDRRAVTLRLSHTKSRRDKPAGVDGANLFVYYGEVAPTREAEWAFLEGTSRTRLTVNLDGDPLAGTVWLTAMWFNRRKQTGLACSPVKVMLAAGEALPRASMKVKKAA